MKKLKNIALVFVLLVSTFFNTSTKIQASNLDLINSIQVSNHDVVSGEGFNVEISFGGQGHQVRPNEKIIIPIRGEGIQSIELHEKSYNLTDENSSESIGVAHVSSDYIQIEFNETAAKLDDIQGGIFFNMSGYVQEGSDRPGKIVIGDDQLRTEVNVQVPEGSYGPVESDKVFRKSGLSAPSIPDTVYWDFHFNEAKKTVNNYELQMIMEDVLDEAMVWEINDQATVTISGHNLNVFYRPGVDFRYDSVNRTLTLTLEEAVERDVLSYTIEGQELKITVGKLIYYNQAPIHTLNQTEIMVRIPAKIKDEVMEDHTIKQVHNYSEVSIENGDNTWIVDEEDKNQSLDIYRSGAWGTGTKRGDLQIHKVIDGKNIGIPNVVFELSRTDNQDIMISGENKGSKIELKTDEKGKISLKGLANGEYQIKEVSAPNWIDFDPDRVEPYTITIKPDDQEGQALKIENQKKKIDYSVEKKWIDESGESLDEKKIKPIQVQLYQNGEKYGEAVTLDTDSLFYVWENLDYSDDDGNKHEYEVKEVNVDKGKLVIGQETFEVTSKSDHQKTVIQNKLLQEETSVSGSKTWNDANNQDGKRPESITVMLLANGEEVERKIVTAEDDWSWEFTGLDKFANGKEINYSIAEVSVEDYSSEIDGYDIINSYTPEKTSIQVTKAWEDANDQDGKRPSSVTVKLLANGQDTEQSLILDASNNWTGTFENLAVYADGKPIEYSVEELEVPGYTANLSGNMEEGFVITNHYEPETTIVSGSKTWNDANNQDGKRPESITIMLLANGEEVERKTVTSEDDWSWDFTGLDKFANGKEINYSIAEVSVEDYSSEIDGYDIINSYTPEKTSIQVTKAWEDANDQDGKRPSSVTVKLLANGQDTEQSLILDASNNWTGTFENLAVYADGKPIEYSVEELEVPGYTANLSGNMEEGFVITNHYEPETTIVSGSKTWNDANNQDGKRPESITIMLLANGEEVERKIVTAEDDWSWEFTGLDKFANGKEINYSIAEVSVEDYSSEVDGYDIINSYTPEKTSIQVTKAWEDANNQDGKRPSSVTVKLLANGQDTEQSLILDASNNWTGTFENLAVYADGKPIEYSVEELEVPGYTANLSGNMEEGFVITNHYEVEEIESVSISPKKSQEVVREVPSESIEEVKEANILPQTGKDARLLMSGMTLFLIGVWAFLRNKEE